MYGIFTYMYHEIQATHVGEYSMPDLMGLVTGDSLLVSSKVDCVNFTVLSADEISTYSEVEVLNQNNYETWLMNPKDPFGGSSQISFK